MRALLCELQDAVRERVIRARDDSSAEILSQVAAVTEADTIYHIDRAVEPVIFEWLEEHWPVEWPLELVMEGLEPSDAQNGEQRAMNTFPLGTPLTATRFKAIIDPIDGTRAIMHDKRSAWCLSAVAPQQFAETRLADTRVAAMTELPPTKQRLADQISGVWGCGLGGIHAVRLNLDTGARRTFPILPSQAASLEHGFVSFAKCFPEGKGLIARVEEQFLEEAIGGFSPGTPLVFEDQYPSTGGQFYELLVGHDRMVADIRPIIFQKAGFTGAIPCHPYDACTMLILQEAGIIIRAPTGHPLDVPLDTTTPVAWVAYANKGLYERLQPLLIKYAAV